MAMVQHGLVGLVKRATPARIRALRAAIREDWIANGRDWTYPGFRAVAVYRCGVFADHIASKPVRAVAMRVYKSLYRWVRNRYGVELEHTVQAGRRLVLGHQGNIVIHRFARIGDDCLIRQNVTIGAVYRAATAEEFAESGPTLQDDVQLGCGAAILGPVVVGRGARIGPNAVVISDVPPGATVFAAPSRVVVLPRGRDAERRDQAS